MSPILSKKHRGSLLSKVGHCILTLITYFCCVISVPSPIISLNRSPPDDLVYTTTQLTITCLVEVVGVDNKTAVTVDSTWTTPDEDNGTTYVDTLTHHVLDSTLTVSSLQSSDSGEYTCSFVVTSPSPYVVTSDPVTDSTTIRAGAYIVFSGFRPLTLQCSYYNTRIVK